MRECGLCQGCPADRLCVRHYLGLLSLLDRKTRVHWPVRANDEGERAPILNAADAAKVLAWHKDWKRSRIAAAKARRETGIPAQLAFPWRGAAKPPQKAPVATPDQEQEKKTA
jgi:hypothetical protein